MIREAKRSEVEEEIRRQVDVLMREELDLLKIVSNRYMQVQCKCALKYAKKVFRSEIFEICRQ